VPRFNHPRYLVKGKEEADSVQNKGNEADYKGEFDLLPAIYLV
jgi:hypothetical protein